MEEGSGGAVAGGGGVAEAAFGPEVGVGAEACEGDAGETEELGGLGEGEGGVWGVQVSGAAVCEVEPVVA